MLQCDWMRGKGLIVAVISVGVSLGLLAATLGGFILVGQNSLQADVSDLRERMARLEGRVDTMVTLFEGHVKGNCEQ